MIEGAECECGKKMVPFRNFCPKCGRRTVKTELEDKGMVLTHTTLYAVPEGFESPIELALIKIEDGVNLLCSYEGEKDLKIGEKVKIKSKGDLYVCEPLK